MKYILIIPTLFQLVLSDVPACHETNKIIYCEHLKLKNVSTESFPFKITSSLEELRLYYCGIRGLKLEFLRNLPQLEVLELDYNSIILRSRMFYTLTNLRTLSLSNNNLRFLPLMLFDGLQKLEKLDLSWNRITSLDTPTFIPLIQVNVINLMKNPLICDEKLKDLKVWSDSRNVLLKGNCMLVLNLLEWSNRDPRMFSEGMQNAPDNLIAVKNQSKINEVNYSTYLHMPVWLFVTVIVSALLLAVVASLVMVRLKYSKHRVSPKDEITNHDHYEYIETQHHIPTYLQVLPQLPTRQRHEYENKEIPFPDSSFPGMENLSTMDSEYLEPRNDILCSSLTERVWKMSDLQCGDLGTKKDNEYVEVLQNS